MRMDNPECMYNDGDEDCYKCVKHGFIYSCMGCKDYKPLGCSDKTVDKEFSMDGGYNND